MRNSLFQIAVLGCMAERLKSKFLEEEKLVDVGMYGLNIHCCLCNNYNT